MYLSKLKLHGFKSFADQTVLEFDPGITAIVGPNGCGKSNIVDAVRWVIGEQRASVLRSEKMENVIFNGTAKRRPIGMAEVELTIQNTRGVLPTEYTEVTLGRRLYRSGESDYLMNQTKSRLKDIRNLFMDTGMGADAYSVIELKMVDEILSESADDRRHLFEEAAGITKYKRRRRQALRKLDTTQADLARVRDLTDEVEKQVRRLKKQAEKAQEYQEYDVELRELELALAQEEYNRLSGRRRKLLEKREQVEQRIETVSGALSKGEARLEALRKTLVDQEQALSERQKVLNEHLEHVRELETERRLEQERRQAAQRDRERTRREQEQAESRQEELRTECERLSEAVEEAEPAVEAAEEELAEAKSERDRRQAAAQEEQQRLRRLRREEAQAGELLEERRRSMDRLTNRVELMEEDQDRLRRQTEELEEQAGELEARHRHAEETHKEASDRADAAEVALREAEEERTEREEALEEALERQRVLERRRDAAAAEVQLLESLVSSYEEFSGAVQFLADRADWSAGELTTVADLLGCDEEHRVALDAALGDLASCIVVADADEAGKALQLLREEEQGQASFLLMDRLGEIDVARDEPIGGGAELLRQHVRVAEPAYRRLADVLLRGVYIISSLERARSLAPGAAPTVRFVTLQGEWMRADGLLHGGSQQAGASPVASRFGRQEQLEATRETLEQLDAELAEQEQAVAAAREQLEAVPFGARRQALTEAEQALSEAEKTRERVQYERETLDRQQRQVAERREQLRGERAEAAEKIEELREDVERAESDLEEVRSERRSVEETFQEAEARSREAVSRHSDKNVAAVEARNRRDTLRRDLERTNSALQELEQRREERADRLSELEEQIETSQEKQDQLDEQLSEVHRNRSGLEENVNEARAELTETKAAISEIEDALRTNRRKREEAVQEENQCNVRLAQIETRVEDLLDDIREDYERALDEEPIELPEDFEPDAVRKRVKTLRRKIKSLGSVNPLALEEYEEERERLNFLLSQREDLGEAEETLLETISEINTTAAERFDETYAAIRSNFRRLFADLFGRGAEADLELEDPDDPLESPIEIRAKPRGKRPTSISQLSSGEKTLTAIALLFAIYLVKPSPFCILDEVDAPLDDMNVERFMKLIRDFSADTQFILVTHNKLTMEAADRLYGVTMQEQGVSQLVGVAFDEAMEFAE